MQNTWVYSVRSRYGATVFRATSSDHVNEIFVCLWLTHSTRVRPFWGTITRYSKSDGSDVCGWKVQGTTLISGYGDSPDHSCEFVGLVLALLSNWGGGAFGQKWESRDVRYIKGNYTFGPYVKKNTLLPSLKDPPFWYRLGNNTNYNGRIE
jgi:hypothetical protein